MVLGDPLEDRRIAPAVRSQPAHQHGRGLDGGEILPDVAARPARGRSALSDWGLIAVVGIALEHVAGVDFDQRMLGALAISGYARRVVELGETRHRRFDRRENRRWIPGRRALAAASGRS